MQMLRKRNPPDKKLEQSTVDSANQKFFWNFKNLLFILSTFWQVIKKVKYVPYMAQLSNKLSHYLSSRVSDREAEGLGFDFLPRNQISLYSKLVTNT